MKLTKLQRYTAYCILLEEAENPIRYDGFLYRSDDLGICYMWFCLTGYNYLYHTFKTILPELYAKRKGDGKFYWDNWGERKEALKQCIIETHP